MLENIGLWIDYATFSSSFYCFFYAVFMVAVGQVWASEEQPTCCPYMY